MLRAEGINVYGVYIYVCVGGCVGVGVGVLVCGCVAIPYILDVTLSLSGTSIIGRRPNRGHATQEEEISTAGLFHSSLYQLLWHFQLLLGDSCTFE